MQWNLIKERKTNNETQEEVAKILGISTAAYASKEKGDTQFKSNEMFLLSRHYNKKIEEIFLPTKYTIRKQTN
ncbi:helix-turn-helix transcriptional regulator [Marinilactibacillus psychrotolerans]|uniref:helix-turn-helix transcriptional regulator n=1 Tax=Marinilactibacillus psychrotolerans TaxID=191770 RepID=UPI00388B5461